MYVSVRDNNVDQALRVLKKKMQREGMFREMKNRRAYEKPSERKAREMAESTRRVRKLMRKRLEREGYQTYITKLIVRTAFTNCGFFLKHVKKILLNNVKSI